MKNALAVVAGVLSALVLYGALTTLQSQQPLVKAMLEETTTATKTITATTKTERFTIMKAETENGDENEPKLQSPREARTETEITQNPTSTINYTPAVIALLSFIVAFGIYTAARVRVYG